MNRLKDNFYLLCADFANTGAEMKEMALNPTKKQKIAVGIVGLTLIFLSMLSFSLGADVFEAISTFCNTVYTKLLAISTPIAVVIFIGALIYSQVCFNPQKVSQVIGICKRVLIVWIVIICAATIFRFIWNAVGTNQEQSIPKFGK